MRGTVSFFIFLPHVRGEFHTNFLYNINDSLIKLTQTHCLKDTKVITTIVVYSDWF